MKQCNNARVDVTRDRPIALEAGSRFAIRDGGKTPSSACKGAPHGGVNVKGRICKAGSMLLLLIGMHVAVPHISADVGLDRAHRHGSHHYLLESV